MHIDMPKTVLALISWSIILTGSVFATMLMASNQFSTVNDRIDALAANMDRKIEGLETKFDQKIEGLETKFDRRFESMDRKIDGLQNLLLQHIALHPETQDAVVANQPVEESNPTG